MTAYRFHGADYQADLDYDRLGSHLERIRTLMSDGQWRTRPEIAQQAGLPESADITKQIRHLRYPEHGRHLVERRRRGDPKTGLYEYRVHPAGTGPVPRRQGKSCEHGEDLEIAELTIQLLVSALRAADPDHALLRELDL